MSEFEFVLALDIGMSRVAAATARLAQSGEITVDSFVLGHGSGSIAAVAFMTDEGDLLFGDAAEQRGFARPEALVRGFTRSTGDETALVVGERSILAEQVSARLVGWAVETATRREGRRPSAVAITHPASWTAHRTTALRTALVEEGLEDVTLVTSPEAAVSDHDASAPLRPGDTIAVYDLGGSSAETTVLRKDGDAEFTILGRPTVLMDVGGSLFDDAVLRHAISTAGAATDVGGSDRDTHVALARLRRASAAAKDRLSFDGDATIPVTLPGHTSSVRITRSELETMIDPALERTLDALEQTVESARRRPDQLDLILLIGGSARIPLVTQRLSERFDRPLATAEDAAAARGAARVQLQRLRNSGFAQIPPAVLDDGGSDRAESVVPSWPWKRLLPALRPALADASTRSATPVLISAAAVVVAVGIAVGAAAAGMHPDGTEVDPVTAGDLQPAAPSAADLSQTNPFDFLLSDATSPHDSAPGTVPLPPSDAVRGDDDRAARDAIRDTLGESTPYGERASSRGPQPENASPSPSPREPRPVTTNTKPVQPSGPGVPTPDQPPAEPPPEEPPPEEPPPEEPPPDVEPPVEQPPAEQPPAEPPADPVPDDPPASDPAAPAPPASDSSTEPPTLEI